MKCESTIFFVPTHRIVLSLDSFLLYRIDLMAGESGSKKKG